LEAYLDNLMASLVEPEQQTIDAYPGDENELLSRLVSYFEESETASDTARREAEMARDYVDGHHWTAEELAILKQRRQPPTFNNIIGRKIALLKGMERRGRSDPKAYPRTPVDEVEADAATQALRFVADDQRYDVIRSSVYENMLVEGFGGCEVIAEQNDADGNINIVINHISWDRLFFDPHSRHPGFSDAKYLGVVIWQDQEDALDAYPDCESILSATMGQAEVGTYEDTPRTVWVDAKRRRVRTVQIYWKRRRDWWMATFVKAGFLEEPRKSPYLDRHGHATCPLILRSALIDRDNNRYGVVRDMIPLQNEINKRHSKLLHSLSVNQIIMEEGAVNDVDLARREVAKPDGIIVKNRGFEFQIQKDQAEIQGHFELLQYTIGQMNAQGPNANLAGKDPREQSGRAIIAQQAGGQVENEPSADALRQHTHKVYERVWMLIRQFWTNEKWIRVTDNDKNVQFVGLNHPITIADLLAKIDHAAPLDMQLKGLSQIDAQAVQIGLRLPPGDPRLNMVVRVENDIDSLDVDIQVEEGPDSPTLQAEQFQAILQLPPQILMQFPPEFIIKASSLRNKDDLVKMLEAHQQQNAQGQQAAQAAQQAMQQAQVAKVQADAADKRASAVERMHGMAIDHAGQNPLLQPDEPDAGNTGPAIDPLAAQAQFHAQQVDRAKLNMAAQQQAHDQALDVAQHGLAVQQAAQPQQAGAAP
jgi:hypothetical protein